MIIIKGLVFVLGLSIVVATLFSAIKTFVLPRAARDPISRLVFTFFRRLFYARSNKLKTYEQRDRLMAYFAPVSLLMMVPVWYVLITFGYTAMFWVVGAGSLFRSFRDSGSSLFTLGFEPVNALAPSLLAFSEAGIGLLLVALLISYLPTMYAAFSRREAAVTLLEVRAGNPPSAVEMLSRYQRIHGLAALSQEWLRWEGWFAEIEESHTSLAALVFFRSPRSYHSWITSAGAILDAASLQLAVMDYPYDVQAALCIRAGYLSLRHIADFFSISYKPVAEPNDPISVTFDEFEQAVNALEKSGVLIKQDRDQAWRDFKGWRVNYDTVLVALCNLVMAPSAPWSSDRVIAETPQPE